MKKVPAVEHVRVSLKDGLTVLDLKPDNMVTLSQLRQIIKNNGFVSQEAKVVARGLPGPDAKTFVVAGTNEQLSADAPPHRAGDNWEFVSRVRRPR